MFENPKFILNSFIIFFSRKPSIRKMAFSFEEKLAGKYHQPLVSNIPDELEPEIPRMIFNSIHGHSQIIISQINIALNVKYSPDWQVDISKGRDYILDKVQILFELLNILNEHKPHFCGITTQAQLKSQNDTNESIYRLKERFFKENVDISNIHDIEFKLSKVISEKFFSNITVENYRTWNTESYADTVPRFTDEIASEVGVQIIGDFNDRYAFNKNEDYSTSCENAIIIIEQGLTEISNEIKKLSETMP